MGNIFILFHILKVADEISTIYITMKKQKCEENKNTSENLKTVKIV